MKKKHKIKDNFRWFRCALQDVWNLLWVASGHKPVFPLVGRVLQPLLDSLVTMNNRVWDSHYTQEYIYTSWDIVPDLAEFNDLYTWDEKEIAIHESKIVQFHEQCLALELSGEPHFEGLYHFVASNLEIFLLDSGRIRVILDDEYQAEGVDVVDALDSASDLKYLGI